jgi:hypothetical protein
MVHSTPRRLSSFVGALFGACALIATAGAALGDFPKYDHVFLIIEENEDFGQVIGNKYAPILPIFYSWTGSTFDKSLILLVAG